MKTPRSLCILLLLLAAGVALFAGLALAAGMLAGAVVLQLAGRIHLP